MRYDSSNRFISRRLISGVSFMSIPSIVFKKWRGAFDSTPSPGNAKIGLRLPYSLSGVFSYQPLTLLIRVGYPQTNISMESL